MEEIFLKLKNSNFMQNIVYYWGRNNLTIIRPQEYVDMKLNFDIENSEFFNCAYHQTHDSIWIVLRIIHV